jgi:hypothetical protein
VDSLGNNLWQITLDVINQAAMPTRLAHDVNHEISRPDYAEVTGATVLTSMEVTNRDLNQSSLNPRLSAQRILVDRLEGKSRTTLRFVVEGSGNVTLLYSSAKGGDVKINVPLKTTR